MGAASWAPAQEHKAEAPAAKISASQAWTVSQVRLVGVKGVSQKSIGSALETKGPGSLLTGVYPKFDMEGVRRDQRRLIKLYQEHGFFKARVKYAVKRNFKKRQVSVIYSVEEGKASLVRSVELKFKAPSEALAWEARLRPGLLAKPGQRFSLSLYQETKSALSRILSKRAHPLHRVLGQVQAYPDENAVKLIFQIEAGPKVFFGPLKITGNQKVSLKLIKRELTFRPGQVFSPDALEKSERKLLELGYFRSVSFVPQYKRTRGNKIPVRLVIQERNPHSIRFGLGWGTEDLFRLRVTQTNRNVLGLGDDLSFEGKLSSIYQGLTADWTLPYFPSPQTALRIEGGRNQRENEAYTSRSWLGRAGIQSRYGKPWSWFIDYNLENTKVTELKTTVPDPDGELQNFLISSIPAGIRYDSRDSVMSPTKGILLSLQNELSLKSLGSDLNFMRPVGEFSFVLPLPLGDRLFFASRMRGGMIADLSSDGNIPLIRRFFPGGADSVRGYPYQHLGPLDDSGSPIGGEVFFESNFEMRFPIEPIKVLKGLGGVLFVDAGNAWEQIDRNMDTLRFTSGAGLRYDTPLGPIRADIGYQLNPPENADFDRWQAYISVGQAF